MNSWVVQIMMQHHFSSINRCHWRRFLARSVCLASLCWLGATTTITDPVCAATTTPQWIWSPEHQAGHVPYSSCHFRKTLNIDGYHSGRIEVAGDDQYELYVNGRRVGEGEGWERWQSHDLSVALRNGRNTIALKATNRHGDTAGVAVRLFIRTQDQKEHEFTSDATWRSHLRPLPLWHLPQYDDRRWTSATQLGPYGTTAPWVVKEDSQGTNPLESADASAPPEKSSSRIAARVPPTPVPNVHGTTNNKSDSKPDPGHAASASGDTHPEFHLPPLFQIQHIVGGDATGSLIAMAFNEHGQIVASREGGPLLLIHDTNGNRVPDEVRILSDRVKSCQGILPLPGRVFVTGDGPLGTGLYELRDTSAGQGQLDQVRLLLKFRGDMGEHGPHAIAMGPDGWLYVMLGNQVTMDNEYDKQSPYRRIYEGDLLQPRYEDPSGHTQGVKAPGGTVIRVHPENATVQRFAGGLRNAYDLVFTSNGQLLTHDSDTESDEGTPWYRPTRVLHVVSGAEFGWRSGWGVWPDTFVDTLPPVLETGRGSPAGMVFYDHTALPSRYHQTVFTCDWSSGRIENLQLRPQGASLTARREVFVQGEPLNVTDIDVSPDGWIYFSTGGRGTRGNIYRIVWKGAVPAEQLEGGDALARAIRQPHPQSAWGRMALQRAKQQVGPTWDRQIMQFVADPRRPDALRARAVDVLQLVGPRPTAQQLAGLAKDAQPLTQARLAYWLGQRPLDAKSDVFASLLKSDDPAVRRQACESLALLRQSVPLDTMMTLLAAPDRHEAWAAGRLWETVAPTEPNAKDFQALLSSPNPRLFVQGALMLTTTAEVSPANARLVVTRFSEYRDQFVADEDFANMLRVVELALAHGHLKPEDLGPLGKQLAEEYPTKSPIINRELVRLMVYLQVPSVTERYLEQLAGDVSSVEKVHLASHMRFLQRDWTLDQRLQLAATYERLLQPQAGSMLSQYMENITRDWTASLSDVERQQVVRAGDRLPRLAVVALHHAPEKPDEAWTAALLDLNQRIDAQEDKPFQQLRVAVLAILAGSDAPVVMTRMREMYEQHPERRAAIAMALAQHPDGENWDYLLRSLPIVESDAAQEVLTKMRTVNRKPQGAEAYRNLILCGLRLEDTGAQQAVGLLEHWTGKSVDSEGTWREKLEAWQLWFRHAYPDAPQASPPEETAHNTWSYHDLVGFLDSPDGRSGSAERGRYVYEKAQCAKCHRYGDVGETVGPDLTQVAQRFRRQELLESILFPSHVISDQYASKSLALQDGRVLTGMVGAGSPGQVVVLQSNGEKVQVAEEQIEEVQPSAKSVMPEGLLNELTLPDIADLFAFLTTRGPARLSQQPVSR